MKTHVNHDNTKGRPGSDTYGQVIADIAKDGVCPFCPEHLKQYHKPELVEKKFWWVTDNMYPYKPTKRHRLIIHKKHISHMNELSVDAWAELLEIIKSETARLGITGGTFIERFGETKFTGASVTHLHGHIVQSDPDDPSYDKIKGLMMRIG